MSSKVVMGKEGIKLLDEDEKKEKCGGMEEKGVRALGLLSFSRRTASRSKNWVTYVEFARVSGLQTEL